MRLHTMIVLSLSTLAVLALAGCSHGSPRATDPTSSASTLPAHQEGKDAPASAPLSSAALSKRLLGESDLGEGYVRKPEQPVRHDDVTVTGCPALDKLSGDAAVGGSLGFPRKAKASFTYAGGVDSEVAEELYSDTEDKLSKGVGRIFDAMTSCPTYQVLVGSTPITVRTQKVPVARMGDERWSLVLTFIAGGRSSVVKQTAIRTGMVVVVISGASALVDAHAEKAVAKALVNR
ncbi:hypothetical protein [Streptomyces sp. NPDC058603]|uniref:hypothetical protein n=1 Tax=Streptomyces sp. NPDC058603 TaxID=3346551 RepID=UPI003661E6E3